MSGAKTLRRLTGQPLPSFGKASSVPPKRLFGHVGKALPQVGKAHAETSESITN